MKEKTSLNKILNKYTNEDFNKKFKNLTSKEISESLNISVRSFFYLKKKMKEREVISIKTNRPVKVAKTKAIDPIEHSEDWKKQRDSIISNYYEKNDDTKIHLVISDLQHKSGCSTEHLKWIANYINMLQPDNIIQLGDYVDMPSLYNYSKDKFNSFDYKEDIKAGNEAIRVLSENITWKCPKYITLGNHEERILRVNKSDKKVGAFMSIDDLDFKKYGWEVSEFLKPLFLDDILYCHYLTGGGYGKAIQTARMLVYKKHMSCVVGHKQHFEIHRENLPNGKSITGLMAGSSYIHDEDYLGIQGNDYGRQIWVLYVRNGSFEAELVSLKKLKTIYEKTR